MISQGLTSLRQVGAAVRAVVVGTVVLGLLYPLAMIGAVGGSLMNLVYPYFLDAKGWRGPAYRRVQMYDFVLAVTAMLVLNLAVWVLGAELLYPDRRIEHLEDLPDLLSHVLGSSGRLLFYAGIFSASQRASIGSSSAEPTPRP